MASAVPFARAAAAALIAVALIVQFVVSMHLAGQRGWDVALTAANFFSLFSVQENILAMVVLTWAAVQQWKDGNDRRESLQIALACVITYALWTSIVYNVFLRMPPGPEGTRVVWSNEVVHLVIPLLLLADLLLAPRTRVLSWRVATLIPVYPLLWGSYTIVRGPLTDNPRTAESFWYPYSFFDPNVTPGGYHGVNARLAAIAAGIGVVGLGVVWITRVRARRASARAALTR